MELTVFTQQGTEAGKITLDDAVFGIKPNDHVMYLDVKHYLAAQRQGTHKIKERGEVSGSTKKPYKQKGTGNARQGHKRSPLWRHGGTVHGPRPRDYSFKLNRKVKQLARRSALSYKAQGGAITVLDSLSFETPRTKAFLEMLSKLNLASTKILFVIGQNDSNTIFSGRNLPNVEFTLAGEMNTYQVLNAKHVVFDKAALEIIHQTLAFGEAQAA